MEVNRTNRTRQGWVAGLLAGCLLVMSASAAQPTPAPTSESKPAAAKSPEVPKGKSAAQRPVYGLEQPPKKYEPKSSGITGVFVRLIGAMVIVLSLLLLGAWWFRKSRLIGLVPAAQANLKIIETRSLASRHALHVVEYGEQRFLIADSPAGTNFLTHLDEVTETADENADNEPEPGSFAAKLKGFLERKKS